jgi:hypothetical protein
VHDYIPNPLIISIRCMRTRTKRTRQAEEKKRLKAQADLAQKRATRVGRSHKRTVSPYKHSIRTVHLTRLGAAKDAKAALERAEAAALAAQQVITCA